MRQAYQEHPTSVRLCSTQEFETRPWLMAGEPPPSKSEIDGRTTKPTRESQFATGWSDAWVRYLDHIAQIDMSHNAPQEERIRCHNLLHLRSVDEDRQAPPLSTSLGTAKQRTHSSQCKSNRDKIWECHLFQEGRDNAWEISSILNFKSILSG